MGAAKYGCFTPNSGHCGVERPLSDGGLNRSLVETLALAMEASLVIRHTPSPIAAVFVESRLGTGRGHAYGTLPPGSAFEDIIALAIAK